MTVIFVNHIGKLGSLLNIKFKNSIDYRFILENILRPAGNQHQVPS